MAHGGRRALPLARVHGGNAGAASLGAGEGQGRPAGDHADRRRRLPREIRSNEIIGVLYLPLKSDKINLKDL